MRIVDTRGINSLLLDKPVFDQIDTDGHGSILRHLIVNYEFVDCEDAHGTKIQLYFSQ